MTNVSSLTDPWIAPPADQGGQAGRLKAYCKVIVNGIDVTNRLDPYLLSVEVHDGGSNGHGFGAQVELDDREGHLPIPPIDAPVQIVLGWVGGESRMWSFWVADIVSSFQRAGGSGRHLTIMCDGANTRTKIKTPMNDHLGDGAPPGSEIGLPISLGQWLQQVAGNGGATAYVHPDLANITRDYWHAAGESPLHHFNRMAEEFGAVTRVQGGNQLVFTVPGETWDATDAPTVTAEWGKNLVAWRVHPWFARSTWVSAHQDWFDHVMGSWITGMQDFNRPMPWGDGSSSFTPPSPAPNSQAASQQNAGVERRGFFGECLITMNGEPAAAWQGHVNVVGARPGVDGRYRILEADHTYSRAGYVTYVTAMPEDVAGYSAPPPVHQFTPEEWSELTSGIDYPPSPAPASVQPPPPPPVPLGTGTQATPSPSEPQGTVTIGTPTGGVTD